MTAVRLIWKEGYSLRGGERRSATRAPIAAGRPPEWPSCDRRPAVYYPPDQLSPWPITRRFFCAFGSVVAGWWPVVLKNKTNRTELPLLLWRGLLERPPLLIFGAQRATCFESIQR